jgi:hypothetical protein
VLGRLWWRGVILGDQELLDFLNEDELVALTERPGVAGNPVLARAIASGFRAAVTGTPDLTRRMDLMRDIMKRMRRMLGIYSFETMELGEVDRTVAAVFTQAVHNFSDTARRSVSD